MRRRILILSGVLLLLLSCAVAVRWRQSHEPVWQGKTVSEWFVEFRKARPLHRHAVTIFRPAGFGGATNLVADVAYSENIDELLRDPAARALRALGTNAVPFLEAELRRGDSLWARSYRSLSQKMPAVIRQHAPAAPPRRDAIRADAALALAALGTNGARAIPTIVKAYTEPACFPRWEYGQSLRRLPTQPMDFDVLLAGFHGTNLTAALATIKDLEICTSAAARILTNVVLAGSIASEALLQLQYYRSQARVVLPALSLALKSSYAQTRVGAARVLRTFGPDAAGALPALTEALMDADEEVRYQSACAMEEMGTNALPAADALSQATNDPSIIVQRVAGRALRNLRSGPGE